MIAPHRSGIALLYKKNMGFISSFPHNITTSTHDKHINTSVGRFIQSCSNIVGTWLKKWTMVDNKTANSGVPWKVAIKLTFLVLIYNCLLWVCAVEESGMPASCSGADSSTVDTVWSGCKCLTSDRSTHYLFTAGKTTITAFSCT